MYIYIYNIFRICQWFSPLYGLEVNYEFPVINARLSEKTTTTPEHKTDSKEPLIKMSNRTFGLDGERRNLEKRTTLK